MKYLPEFFFEQCERLGPRTAFHYYAAGEGRWKNMSWGEYRAAVGRFAAWLQNQGVKPGDKVGILSANRPEWMIADLAILSVGCVSVPVYATSSPKDVGYIAEHSEAKIFVVDTAERARALADCRLDHIVLLNRASGTQSAPVTAWDDIQATNAQPLTKPVAISGDDIATIIYTSGTTGVPKGVMHSHHNFAEVMKPVQNLLMPSNGEVDRFFSFLPLSHVAERTLVELGSITMGAEVAFARSVANLAEDLVHCRPTILLCVPRLWEKMYEKITAGVSRADFVKRTMFNLALWAGRARVGSDRILRSSNNSLGAKICDALVGKKLRARLGMDRARVLVTGSAPTRRDVMEFFGAFGLMITEAYGLTENLCLGTHCELNETRFGSCGTVFEGNEMRIAEDGEILFRAPWMFKGYYKNDEATQAVLTADGWFHTGDLGKVDEQGYLQIVGRKKELLKTSTGKYVAPVPIEDKLKACSHVADAMVVGDNQKYCIALISLEEGVTLATSKVEIVSHLSEINKSLANHESIKRIGILEEGFSVESGTLTPTLKLKRSVAFQQFESFIGEVYIASETVVLQS